MSCKVLLHGGCWIVERRRRNESNPSDRDEVNRDDRTTRRNFQDFVLSSSSVRFSLLGCLDPMHPNSLPPARVRVLRKLAKLIVILLLLRACFRNSHKSTRYNCHLNKLSDSSFEFQINPLAYNDVLMDLVSRSGQILTKTYQRRGTVTVECK